MPLKLAIDALGGSFSARLMRTVRDEDGLTYSVGSRLEGFGKSEAGAWHVYGEFSPKLLDQGITSIQKQLKDWKQHGIGQAELGERSQGAIGRYLVAQSVPAELYLMSCFLSNGFGADRVIQYPKRLELLLIRLIMH